MGWKQLLVSYFKYGQPPKGDFMFYFKVREYDCDFCSESVFSSNQRLPKGSVVVIPNDYNNPTTATIVEKVEEYIALSNKNEIEQIICTVDMNEYKKRLHAKNKKALILRKMQDQLSEVKLIETLKKYSEKDDSMRALMQEYNATENETASTNTDEVEY